MAGGIGLTGAAYEHSWTCRYGQLSGLSWGHADQPVIIALHGWLDNAASFARMAPFLTEYQVIAPDLPGHGHSNWLGDGGEYAIWSGVEAVYDLIGQLSLNHPPVILGHSMGSGVGMLLAGAFPEFCRAFIALDALGPIVTPASGAPSQLAQGIRQRRVRSSAVVHSYQSIDDALMARVKNNSELSTECIKPVVQRNLQRSNEGLSWRTDPRLRDASKVRLTEEQVAAFCKQITVPSLSVRAEQGLMAAEIMRSRCAYFSNMTYRELPGHHHFHLDPVTCKTVAQLLVRFIQGLT